MRDRPSGDAAAPNHYAVGTRVEVYRAGTLGAARPTFIEDAHADATPIHIGLGQAKQVDLRITFPGKAALELRNVEALERMEITPDGKMTRIKTSMK